MLLFQNWILMAKSRGTTNNKLLEFELINVPQIK